MASLHKTEDIVLPVCEQSADNPFIAVSASPWKSTVMQEALVSNFNYKLADF